jgi:hypothetical protein
MGGLRGYNGAKKLVGRKRHILVDTQGFLLTVVVHPASIPDREGGKRVLAAAEGVFPRLRHIWADQGYTGTLVLLPRPGIWAEGASGLSPVSPMEALCAGVLG